MHEAYKTAQKIRGEGEAKANIFTHHLNQKIPPFMNFKKH